jgi:hypothetical protein
VAAAVVAASALLAGCAHSRTQARATGIATSATTSTAAPMATVATTTPGTEPPSTTSTSLTLTQQVEQAYLHHWEVYAQALRTLDPSHLADVFAGDALRSTEKEVADLKASHTPEDASVEHHYSIVFHSRTQAVVVDNYRNHFRLLDERSGQPIEPDPNTLKHFNFTMELRNGTWLVTFVIEAK